MGIIGKSIRAVIGFVRAWRIGSDPDNGKDPVDVVIAEQVRRELDMLPPEFRLYVAGMVKPPYHSGSIAEVRELVREQEVFCRQVERELDTLPPRLRHLVDEQVKPPYDSGSSEKVRQIIRQLGSED